MITETFANNYIMKHLFTISLCFLTLSLSAQETITYPYNPDGYDDGAITVPDLQNLLGGESVAGGQGGCTIVPSETPGPYPLDLSDNTFFFRQDITEDIPGIRVIQRMRILGVDNCLPIPNLRVNLWCCDAEGNYSGYGTEEGETFMRGYQITDDNGEVEFISILPGWYPGRVLHMHFQVHVSSAYAAVSQFTWPHLEAVDIATNNPSIYMQGPDPMTPETDGAFADGYEHQLATLVWDEALESFVSDLEVAIEGEGTLYAVDGCTTSFACNYDPEATVDDGSCEYLSCTGCTDEAACNYDPTVSEDNGSCSYIIDAIGICGGSCSSDLNNDGICDIQFCPEDINGDGVISVQDLLLVLSEFGCSSFCENDINQDGYVAVQDILQLLSEFGNTCEISGFQNCGDLITHDGYDYSTVQIGDQCWFSENCRYLPVVSPSSASSTTDPYYYVYDYQGTDVIAAQTSSYYGAYGVLYNWPALMTEGICPSGWHMPSDGEFTQLSDFLGGDGVAGGKMKEAGYDHWNSPNTGATNSSGFNGLPGGCRYSGGFSDNGDYGFLWSTSESGSNSWLRLLNVFNDDFFLYFDYLSYGFSARCVQD